MSAPKRGVLFRGGAEGRIRQQLIEEKLLDAVVGPPAQLFPSTGIPVCIVIFDRAREKGGAREGEDGVMHRRCRIRAGQAHERAGA